MALEHRTVFISAPQHRVWAALSDLGATYAFDSAVADPHRGDCLDGGGIEGESMWLRVLEDGRGQSRRALFADFVVAPDGPGSTVTLTADYSAFAGRNGFLLGPLARLRGSRAISQILTGLKQYVEAGGAASNPTTRAIPVAA